MNILTSPEVTQVEMMQPWHDDSKQKHHVACEVVSEARDSLIKRQLIELVHYITCCWTDLLQEYLLVNMMIIMLMMMIMIIKMLLMMMMMIMMIIMLMMMMIIIIMMILMIVIMMMMIMTTSFIYLLQGGLGQSIVNDTEAVLARLHDAEG